MEQREHSKFDAALIILFCTLIGYAVAYAFEFGYYAHYDLPIIFIDLNVTNITKAIFITLVIVGSYLYFIGIITDLLLKNKANWGSPPIQAIFLISITIIIGGAILGITNAENKDEYLTISDKGHYSVVLTSYKDHLVIASVDLKSKTISPNFSVVEMKSLRSAEVVVFPNGLKVKDKRDVESIQKKNDN